MEGGEETKVGDSLNSQGQFAVTDLGTYFIARPEAAGAYNLDFCDFASDETREIVALPGRPGFGLSVSPDGRYILYTQTEQQGTDLMLVENFR